MPTKSTFRSGAMTSRMPLFAAAARSAALGRLDDVAARLLVRLKLDQPLLAGLLEQVGKGAESVVGLVEAGVPALERLLHHRAPDPLFRSALRRQGFQGAEHEVERFLLLVLPGRRRLAAFLRRAALVLLGAHQIVVVDELVAVVDEQIRARVLDP